MENQSILLNSSIIKIEAEDHILKDEIEEESIVTSIESVNNEEMKCSDLSSKVKLDKSCEYFRPSRLSNRRTPETGSNIYAKPRMHFTGKGIVTKTEPGYSFTLKTKRGRKVRLKTKVKDEMECVAESGVSSEITVDSGGQTNKEQDIKIEVECDTDGESFFYIKKKRDRKFPKVLQTEDNHIHPNYYMGQKGSTTGTDDVDLKLEEDFVDTEAELGEDLTHDQDDIPVNSFLNRKMFKRIGHYSNCVVECTVCYKQMKDSSMKQHFKTHSGAKPFPCNFCGARFTRKGDVYRHRKTIHRNEKPFECSMCERRFVERKGLITHLQNHDRMLYYGCSTCGFKFGKKEYYENHVRFIHPLPEGQTLTDVKDIVDKGMKQLEVLLREEKEETKSGKKSASTHLEDFPNVTQEEEEVAHVKVKKENQDDHEFLASSDDSKMDPLSPPDSCFSHENPDEDELLKTEEPFEEPFVNVDDVSVVKGTLSLMQTVLPPSDNLESREHYDEEEELVNKAILAAVSQAETALESIQSTIGNNMTSKSFPTPKLITPPTHLKPSILTAAPPAKPSYNPISQLNSPTPAAKLLKKAAATPSEIHISASVGGAARKFIVQVPCGSNVDVSTQEGMDALVNMVNYLCSGKGELEGPVQVAMHHAVHESE